MSLEVCVTLDDSKYSARKTSQQKDPEDIIRYYKDQVVFKGNLIACLDCNVYRETKSRTSGDYKNNET